MEALARIILLSRGKNCRTDQLARGARRITLGSTPLARHCAPRTIFCRWRRPGVGDATANGSASITALDQFGTAFNFSLPLSGAGQNFFTLTIAGGELISRVSFTTTVGLDEVSQVRFGDTIPVPGPIVGAGCRGRY